MKRSGEQSHELPVGLLIEEEGQFVIYLDNRTIVLKEPPTFPFAEYAGQGTIAADSSVYMRGDNIVDIKDGFVANENYREEYENGSVSFSGSMKKYEPSDDEFSQEMEIAVYADDKPDEFGGYYGQSSSSSRYPESSAPPLESLPIIEPQPFKELDEQLVILAQELISDLRGIDRDLLSNLHLLFIEHKSFSVEEEIKEFTFIAPAETYSASINGDIEKQKSRSKSTQKPPAEISGQAIRNEVVREKLVSWQEEAAELGLSVEERENLVLLENVLQKLDLFVTLIKKKYPKIGADDLILLLEQHLRGGFITADHLSIIDNINERLQQVCFDVAKQKQNSDFAGLNHYMMVSFSIALNIIARDASNTHSQQTEQRILDEMLIRFESFTKNLPDSIKQDAKCSETLKNLEFILKTTTDVDDFTSSFDSFITQQLEEVNRANSPDKSHGEKQSFSFATMTKFFSSKTSKQEMPKQSTPQQPTPLDQLIGALMEFKAIELVDLQQQRMQTRIQMAKQASSPSLRT